MTATPAEDALQQAALGDQAAFASLVREHQAMVYSICWHYLHDRAAAEELAQEVFLTMHQSLGQIESARHLTWWLRRVTTNRCIDQTRRGKLRPRVGLDQAPEPAAPPQRADPMLSGLLERLVAGLPERARMIVILRYQEEMEPAEIAEALDIPVGTVKSNLHRSLAVLRNKLERVEKGVVR